MVAAPKPRPPSINKVGYLIEKFKFSFLKNPAKKMMEGRLPKIEDVLYRLHTELKDGRVSSAESDTPYMKMLFNRVLNKAIDDPLRQKTEI